MRTYSEIMRPIFPMSVSPLNSNLAVKPLENVRTSSLSGISSTRPGVWIAKNCTLEKGMELNDFRFPVMPCTSTEMMRLLVKIS